MLLIHTTSTSKQDSNHVLAMFVLSGDIAWHRISSDSYKLELGFMVPSLRGTGNIDALIHQIIEHVQVSVVLGVNVHSGRRTTGGDASMNTHGMVVKFGDDGKLRD
jgi:hypothetical protein